MTGESEAPATPMQTAEAAPKEEPRATEVHHDTALETKTSSPGPAVTSSHPSTCKSATHTTINKTTKSDGPVNSD